MMIKKIDSIVRYVGLYEFLPITIFMVSVKGYDFLGLINSMLVTTPENAV